LDKNGTYIKTNSSASRTKQEGISSESQHLFEVGAGELGHAEKLDRVGTGDAAIPVCNTVD